MSLEHPQRDGEVVIAPASRIAVVTSQCRNSETFEATTAELGHIWRFNLRSSQLEYREIGSLNWKPAHERFLADIFERIEQTSKYRPQEANWSKPLQNLLSVWPEVHRGPPHRHCSAVLDKDYDKAGPFHTPLSTGRPSLSRIVSSRGFRVET